jgi:hypothetical protein
MPKMQDHDGRLCLYLEDRVISVARMVTAKISAEGMSATLAEVAELPPVCFKLP